MGFGEEAGLCIVLTLSALIVVYGLLTYRSWRIHLKKDGGDRNKALRDTIEDMTDGDAVRDLKSEAEEAEKELEIFEEKAPTWKANKKDKK